MTQPFHDTRVETRGHYLFLLSTTQERHQLTHSYNKMASNRENRIQQAIADYESRRYFTIRAAAAANDLDRKTLGRRLQGGLSRIIAHEPQRFYQTNKSKC